MASPYIAPYMPRSRRGGEYGSPYGGREQAISPLMIALMQIMQNKEQQSLAQPLAPEGEAFYESDYLAPYLEGLTPLGRFTDMGLRDKAAMQNAVAKGRAAALEKSRLQQILQGIRRQANTQGPIESIESVMPNGNMMVEAQTTPENFGVPTAPIADRTLLSPTGQVIGSATYGPSKTSFTVGGMAGDEWFQRAANAQGANKFASPEPGYQGVPMAPGSSDWNSWEKATAMIRKNKKK